VQLRAGRALSERYGFLTLWIMALLYRQRLRRKGGVSKEYCITGRYAQRDTISGDARTKRAFDHVSLGRAEISAFGTHGFLYLFPLVRFISVLFQA